MRVLLVEDETQLAQALAKGLRRYGFAVDVAHDGEAGLSKAIVIDYDAIVLDRDLPRIHGDEVCQRLHQRGHPARVLMLTAAAELQEVIAGLDLGADDYLTKPVRLAELAARLRALGRRGSRSDPTRLSRLGLELDPARLVATRDGRPLGLTSREFAVLEMLMRADGRVVSAEELLTGVWDENADPFTASVRVMMSRLRRKLGEPPLIRTVVGRGYQL